jgi:hypothetical protein
MLQSRQTPNKVTILSNRGTILKTFQADREFLIESIVADYPSFNVLINNAGIQKKVLGSRLICCSMKTHFPPSKIAVCRLNLRTPLTWKKCSSTLKRQCTCANWLSLTSRANPMPPCKLCLVLEQSLVISSCKFHLVASTSRRVWHSCPCLPFQSTARPKVHSFWAACESYFCITFSQQTKNLLPARLFPLPPDNTAAMHSFTISLRQQMVEKGIKVNLDPKTLTPKLQRSC